MARHDTKMGVLAVQIAGGASISEAAEAVRVSISTVKRRRSDPAFMRYVAELRGEMVTRAAGKAADAMVQAVETLRDLLTSGGDAARLGAARAILEHEGKLRESIDLSERIAALERHLGVKPNGRPQATINAAGRNGRGHA
jgi:hypothetical protein